MGGDGRGRGGGWGGKRELAGTTCLMQASCVVCVFRRVKGSTILFATLFAKLEESNPGILACVLVSAMQRLGSARFNLARVVRWGLGTVRLPHPKIAPVKNAFAPLSFRLP